MSRECICCGSRETIEFLRLSPDIKTVSSWGVPSSPQTIFKCLRCGLQFTDRIISHEEEKDMYAQVYHDLMAGTLGESEKKTGALEQSGLRIKLVKKHVSTGALLDVGCSTGIFLEKARQEGFAIFGLDTSEYACKVARERLQLEEDRIVHATISDAVLLREKKFDVITAWDVLEHCSKPREDMERMVGALKPGGVLVIRTPNTSSIFFQTALLLYRLTLKRVTFPLVSLYHSDHLVFFNRSSLGNLFSSLGIKTLQMTTDPLQWKRFRYCECRRGPWINAAIGGLYFLGRAFGGGHGLIGIGRKI